VFACVCQTSYSEIFYRLSRRIHHVGRLFFGDTREKCVQADGARGVLPYEIKYDGCHPGCVGMTHRVVQDGPDQPRSSGGAVQQWLQSDYRHLHLSKQFSLLTRGSISDVKAAYSSVSLPVLFSSSSSSAVACKEIARSLPRSELGSTTLRTLGSIGSHEGATRSMTKKMHLKFTRGPLIITRGSRAGVQIRKEMHSMHSATITRMGSAYTELGISSQES
jgi:hypothetical protein